MPLGQLKAFSQHYNTTPQPDNFSLGKPPQDPTAYGLHSVESIQDASEVVLSVLALLGLPEDLLIAGTVHVSIKGLEFLKKILALKRKGFNPFKSKTAKEIQKIFEQKGFEFRGPNPLKGYGGYVNPQTNRSYHIDYNHPTKLPHVDVNRPRGYKGDLDKKRLYKDDQ